MFYGVNDKLGKRVYWESGIRQHSHLLILGTYFKIYLIILFVYRFSDNLIDNFSARAAMFS